MSDYYLALDQGGHASRAIAFDSEGRQLAKSIIEVATQTPAQDRYEQDPDAVVASLEQCARLVTTDLQDHSCLGAGLATQRSSIACWDRQTGQALSPVISWRDTRNAAALTELDLDEQRVHELTGLRISAHYGASKLRWCLDNIAAVQDALKKDRLLFGPLASFLIFRLTGEKTAAADPVNASRTLLWEPANRCWSDELVALFDLPATALPPSRSENEGFGTLRVCPDIPLLRCTGDQAAAIYARGVPAADEIIVNAGTGAFALQSTEWPNDSQGVLTSVVGGERAGLNFALEGTVNGAGSALKAEARKLKISNWHALLETPDRELSPIPVFLNGHSGLGSPWWVPHFESRLIGDAGPVERMIAVAESIIFLLQANLDEFVGHAATPRCIVASGGVSTGDGFCRRLASLSGLPVYRHRISEATAQGLAWQIADLDSQWPAAAQAELFEPQTCTGLHSRYAHWQELMAAACGSNPV
ncbi:MAG: FGGY family carbohydrate kinase [Gammaproteobacteria bacterium]